MITLHYSTEEMETALKKIGYIITTDTELFESKITGNYSEDVPYTVINVRHPSEPDKKMAEWAGAGTRRLEYSFEQLLRKKLLNLF